MSPYLCITMCSLDDSRVGRLPRPVWVNITYEESVALVGEEAAIRELCVF